MLKLKLQYFGHLMRRSDSLEKTVMLGKIEGRRRSAAAEDEMVDGITDSMDKILMLGKIEGRRKSAATEDEMVGWHP